MPPVFVGIDTSCYTTSLAVCNIAGDILMNKKILLPVEKEKRGLRQSEAVFLHIKNLNELLGGVRLADLGEIKGVAASGRPRPVQGSYMPVFQVSKCIAAAVSSATGAFFIETTHQHAHIAAAMLGNDVHGDFLAVHLSGGTSEILSVQSRRDGEKEIKIVGQTLDIPAGQLIDRIGQKMGFAFPCGPFLEQCAAEAAGALRFKVSTADVDFHFSGVEAQAARALDAGISKPEVCMAVQEAVVRTILQAIDATVKREGVGQTLLFGGVVSNEFIRNEINKAPACRGIRLYFAKKEYSADNAAGLAVIARNLYKKEEEL